MPSTSPTQTLSVLALALTGASAGEYRNDRTSEWLAGVITVLVGGYIVTAIVAIIFKWTDRMKDWAGVSRTLDLGEEEQV